MYSCFTNNSATVYHLLILPMTMFDHNYVKYAVGRLVESVEIPACQLSCRDEWKAIRDGYGKLHVHHAEVTL